MQKFPIIGLLATSIIFGMAPALAGDRDHKPNFRAEHRHEHPRNDRVSHRDDYRYYQRYDQYRDRRFYSHDNRHYKYTMVIPAGTKKMITIGEVSRMITSTSLVGQCC